MGWQVVPLGKCCDVVSGATPKRQILEYWGGDIAWATPKDISALDGPVLTDTPEYITIKGYKSCSARLMPKGSILFSSRAPIGLVAIAGREMCTNQGFKSLVPGPDVDSKYLYYCMKRVAPQIADLGNGATFKEVSKEIVSSFEIPLPPLEEQKRIAAILDKADGIRRKRRQAMAMADEFLRSVFLDMFGDPVTNPKGWEVKKLKEVLTGIDSGWSPKCLDRPAHDDEIGILKLSAVTSGIYLEDENKALPIEGVEKKIKIVNSGDVIFTRKNTYDLVAATAYVHETHGNVALPDLIFRLNIRSGSELLPEYLWAVLSHKGKRSSMQRLAGGAAGSMPNISKAKLLGVTLPVPPIKEQHKFAQVFHANWKWQSMNDVSRQGFDDLLFSATQRFFSASSN